METDKVRQAFEKWADSTAHDLPLARYASGVSYMKAKTEVASQAFAAGAAYAQSAAPPAEQYEPIERTKERALACAKGGHAIRFHQCDCGIKQNVDAPPAERPFCLDCDHGVVSGHPCMSCGGTGYEDRRAKSRAQTLLNDLFAVGWEELSDRQRNERRVKLVTDLMVEYAASERAEGFRQGMKDAVKIAKDFAQVSQGPGISTGLAIAAECNRRALLPEPPQGGQK